MPDFTRASSRSATRELAREQFKGRSTAVGDEGPADAAGARGRRRRARTRPLTFARDGAGTLFYTARLRYAADALFQQGLDRGSASSARYAPYVENGTPAGRHDVTRPAISCG